MNTDNLHDAIGNIDEKLIKQVEDLRKKPVKKHYARYLVLAACFCIVLAVTVVAYKTDLFSSDKVADSEADDYLLNEDNAMADSDMTEPPQFTPEEFEQDDFISDEGIENELDSDSSTGNSSMTDNGENSAHDVEKSESNTIYNTAVFKVNTVTEQGFLGTVIESDDLERDAVYTVTCETVDIELKENDTVEITYTEISDRTISAIKAELRFS